MDALRAEYRLSPDDRVLLMVSRFGMHAELLAGVNNMVDAVELLARDDARVRLVMLGDRAARPMIEEQARAVNAGAGREVVTFAGRVEDLAPPFAASDVVVAMATSALGAMACGKPTVVCGPDGTIELPDHDALERYQSTGAFARELGTPDVKAISRMLGALLDDPAAARDLAAVEQVAVAANWSSAAAAEAIERVYAEAITDRPSRAVVVADAARTAWWYGRSRARSALRRARTRSLEPA